MEHRGEQLLADDDDPIAREEAVADLDRVAVAQAGDRPCGRSNRSSPRRRRTKGPPGASIRARAGQTIACSIRSTSTSTRPVSPGRRALPGLATWATASRVRGPGVECRMDVVDVPLDLRARQRGELRPDRLAGADGGDVGFQHLGDDRDLRRVDDVVEVLVGGDDLAGADVGVRDDAVDGARDRQHAERPLRRPDAFNRRAVQSQGQELLRRDDDLRRRLVPLVPRLQDLDLRDGIGPAQLLALFEDAPGQGELGVGAEQVPLEVLQLQALDPRQLLARLDGLARPDEHRARSGRARAW